MKTAALLVFLVACGSSGDSGPHADLQVTFGVDPARTLASAPSSGMTDSRLMIQVAQGDTKVFVSLQWPSSTNLIQLDASRTDVQVWAQLGSEPPRVAESGKLELTTIDGTMNVTMTDVAKPQNVMGGSLAMSGLITGVKL